MAGMTSAAPLPPLPSRFWADLSTRDFAALQSTGQAARLVAVLPVAAFPVDAGGDGGARRQCGQQGFLPRCGHMRDVIGGVALGILALARVGNRDFGAIGQHQYATVARLAAAQGVKHRAVQHDAGIGHGGDVGAAFAQVGVLAEEVVGHGVISIVRIRSSLSTSCVWEIAYADYTPEAQELAQFSRS